MDKKKVYNDNALKKGRWKKGMGECGGRKGWKIEERRDWVTMYHAMTIISVEVYRNAAKRGPSCSVDHEK